MSNQVVILVEKLHDDVVVPCLATSGSSGFDLKAYLKEEDKKSGILIEPLSRKLVMTGLKFGIPENMEIQIRPRSGFALKQGVTVLNTPGTIDSDYTGEVGVILYNSSSVAVTIEHGDRIAQGVLGRVLKPVFQTTESLDSAYKGRGAGGFGSTGMK